MRRLGTMVLAAGLAAMIATPAFAQRNNRQPGGRGFGPASGLMLLNNKSVKDELKIGEDAGKKIEDAGKELREKFMSKFQDAGMDREKMAAVRKEMAEAGSKVIDGLLTKEQLKRFKQIEVQVAGFRAFDKEEVQSALKLTDDQKKQVKELSDDVQKESRELRMAAGRDRDKQAEANKKIEALNTKAMETTAKTLTDDQKKTWKDLVGEKFEYKPDMPRRDI
jgi:hypothetical protein